MVLHTGELDKSAHEATQMTTAQAADPVSGEAGEFKGPLEFARRNYVERMAAQFHTRPSDLSALQSFGAPPDLVGPSPLGSLGVQFWKIRNLCFEVGQITRYAQAARSRQQSNRSLDEWLRSFGALGEKLSLGME
jgi:hypothetical protein